jgi:hypothetical protein
MKTGRSQESESRIVLTIVLLSQRLGLTSDATSRKASCDRYAWQFDDTILKFFNEQIGYADWANLRNPDVCRIQIGNGFVKVSDFLEKI